MEHDVDSSRLPSLRTVLLVAGGLLGLCLITYWASLTNRFVAWDDTYLIYFNPALKAISPETLTLIFTTYDPELYVPFTLFSYQLDYLIGELNPFVYHLHSLLLHAGSAILVAWVVARLSGKRVAGLVAGVLFAVHPLHVEAVSWASGRKDVLSTFWMMLSLAFWLRWRDAGGKKTYLGSVAAFALALMAKVMVLTLPLVLLLVDFLQRRKVSKEMLVEKLPHFGLSILFGVIGLFGKKDITAASTLAEKILMAGKSTAFYLQKLVAPTGLSVIYPYTKEITIASPDFWVPLLVVLSLVAATLWTLRRTRFIAFGVAFFLLTLSPTFINFIKGGDLYFASDRYAYVPSIGLFLLAGMACAMLWEHASKQAARSVLIGIGAVVGLVLCMLTYNQSLVWKNSETLFLHNLTYYPEAIAARINLGRVYRESGRMDEAQLQLEEALKLRPHPRVYANLGALAAQLGKKEEALALYRKGAEVDPTDPEPVFGIGIVYAEQKKYAEAEAMYKKAIELKAQFVGVYNNLGALYLEQRRYAEAEEQYRRAIEIDPYYADAHYNLAHLMSLRDDVDGAIKHYERVLLIDPMAVDTVVQLWPLYVQAGRNDAAVRISADILRRRPDDANAQRAALDTVKAVLKVDPQHAGARALLERMEEMGLLRRRNG